MTTNSDERQLREAIRQARELQARTLEMTENFPPEGHELRDKLRAAAKRTVVNLELALEAFLKEAGSAH